MDDPRRICPELRIPITFGKEPCRSQPSHQDMSKRSAFTLIELLVVIAIIAILAAMLFPVFASAKLAAKKSQDLSNMRQIGMSIALYTHDYEGSMPLTSHDTGLPAWIDTLRPYMSNCDEVRICPVDPKGKERLQNKGTSYVLNEYVTPLESPPEGSFSNLDALPRPSETYTTFVVSDERGVEQTEDHTHSGEWVEPPYTDDWGHVLHDIQPDRFRQGTAQDPERRLEGQANYLFADSHVKSHPALKIKGWIDARINFAKPPQE